MSSSGDLTLVSKTKLFEGSLETYTHHSSVCNCEMRFSIFFPPQKNGLPNNEKLPTLYWLSGLTCTDENFMVKSGAQRFAAEQGVILIAPDTSPRGTDVPDALDQAWDFGLGAGFYLNATESPWSANYRIYDYIVSELPFLIESHFPSDPHRKSIFGHSMGGHGALTIALKILKSINQSRLFPHSCSYSMSLGN